VIKFSAAVARMFTASALAVLIAFVASAAQHDYPSKPVRLVSGYAPGGTTSLVGRLIGERLTESWGQQFVLDNRPGGGTLIGAEIVARMCSPICVDKAIQKKIEVDVLRLLKTPEIRQRLVDLGVDVEPLGSAEFAAFFRAETAKWIKTARGGDFPSVILAAPAA
jgi:tripartite-type tricarboxylate transporter receptor subunit TctC